MKLHAEYFEVLITLSQKWLWALTRATRCTSSAEPALLLLFLESREGGMRVLVASPPLLGRAGRQEVTCENLDVAVFGGAGAPFGGSRPPAAVRGGTGKAPNFVSGGAPFRLPSPAACSIVADEASARANRFDDAAEGGLSGVPVC